MGKLHVTLTVWTTRLPQEVLDALVAAGNNGRDCEVENATVRPGAKALATYTKHERRTERSDS